MPASIKEIFEAALKAHQRSDLPRAESLYKAILAADPRHASAAHMLGALYLQAGNAAFAAKFLRQAIECNAGVPEMHNALGQALVRLGRLEDAIGCYRQALTLRPDYPNALGNLGNALRLAGRLGEAIAAYDLAIAAAPKNADLHFNRGGAFESTQDTLAALSDYDAALALRKDFPEALNNRGTALHALGRMDAALASIDQALRLRPNYAEALVNRGATCFSMRRFEAAIESLDTAITLNPRLADAFSNRANVFREIGRMEDALTDYAHALAIEPDHIEAQWNQALTELVMGNWDRGLAGYEIRKRKAKGKLQEQAEDVARPWQGESLTGARLLLYAEQGFGDTLQFVRFAPVLSAMGASVTLLAPPRLHKLLASIGKLELRHQLSNTETFDYQAALMSLPGFLRLTPQTVPPLQAYLAADPERVAFWREKLAGRNLKIGLSWQGNPKAAADNGRSLPLAALSPLAQLPDIAFVSLQKGYGSEQVAGAAFHFAFDADDGLDEGAGAFIDTAAIIQNLDLVITSDTAICHLAGALGRPVWLLLKYVPDWRWLMHRRDTPWYPSARLYRQKKLDDWDGVVADILADLKRLSRPDDRAAPK